MTLEQPQPFRFVYGTAGFRAEANTALEEVVRRTVFYAAIRARTLGKSMGLMITASHNPAKDNGIKLVDPSGRMLPMECECQLTELVNTSTEEFNHYRTKALAEPVGPAEVQPAVVIATDTRPSSKSLFHAAIEGIQGTGVRVEPFEHHTTPQLHFIVRAINDKNFSGGYVSRFRSALSSSFELIPFDPASDYTKQLFVDCANGVGALWADKYLADVEIEVESGEKTTWQPVCPVELKLLNTDTQQSELLNHECGADFVKIRAQLPANFAEVPVGARCASIDGDADRLVYFYPTEEGKIVLLDGDHIAALFAKFIQEQFKEAERFGQPIPLAFGVVQTAYANGNSTRFFQEQLGLKPVLAKTGVKHLEKAAHRFDIGLYFEANGHGTCCFSDKFHTFMAEYGQQKKGAQFPKHIRLLALFSALVNDVVGDGIADLLAVECLLRHFGWSIQQWEQHTYVNMPNVQFKVPVPDRSKFATADDNETQLVRPEGMQAKIDAIVGTYKGARAFIRPSGTEQIVRIYSEAASQAEASELAQQLAQLIDSSKLTNSA